MAGPVHVSKHPLVAHKLARLRHRDTPPPEFRALVANLSKLLLFEATADLPLSPVTVPTPLADCESAVIGASIGMVPILRAGLGMADAMLELLPTAVVWHLGLYRDHDTLEPKEYYNKLPAVSNLDLVLVLDPMLATGGTAIASIDALKKWGGCQRTKFIGLIASPEGVEKLREAHPDVPIYLAAIDEQLNEIGYIVPGLGDAGDRQFGTW